VRIHFAAEHAAKLQRAHLGFELGDFLFYVDDGCIIALGLGQLQQFAGIGERSPGRIELLQIGAQPGAFAPQFLRPLGIVPDILLFKLADDLFQTLLLGVVVKETPEGRPCAPRGRAGSS
jgi:hypothetical protein